MTALRPFKRETMVRQYGEDPHLLERRQRRSQLADDLLEDIVDDSEIEDTADEPSEAPLEGQPAIAEDEDGSPVTRVSTRSPIEMEEWGEAPDKLDEVEPEIGDIELEEGIDDPERLACSRPMTKRSWPAQWKKASTSTVLSRRTSKNSGGTRARWTSWWVSCRSCTSCRGQLAH